MARGAPTTQSRLPLWLKLVLILSIIVGIGLIGLEFWNRAATARWHRYANKLRENGLPLTLAEVEAHRTVIPDDKNGAKVIQRLAGELNDLARCAPPNTFVLGDNMRNRSLFFEGVPRQHIEASREFRQKHESLIASLQALELLPAGRFSIDLSQSNPLFITLPELSCVRMASKWIRLDSGMRLIDGDIDGAGRGVRMQCHLAATLDQHPSVIGRLVQIAVEAGAANSIENILRVGQVDTGLLLRLHEDVDSRLSVSTMKWAWFGERAVIVGVFAGVISGQFTFDEIMGGGGTSSFSLSNFLPVATFRYRQLRAAERMTWLIEADDDPAAMQIAVRRYGGDGGQGHVELRPHLKRHLLPDFTRAVTLHVRVIASLRCIKAVLASERFRLDTGRLPGSLIELVTTYLPKIPIDPFDGRPLRLATIDEGIVIYSVNDNAVDDGGSVERPSSRRDSLDVGFRLFDPFYRGLLLIDMVED